MIKAVLLDLDNTLLRNPDSEWVAAFRRQWDLHFAEVLGIDKASSALRHAVSCLNQAPVSYRANAAIMLSALSAELRLPEALLASAIADFYTGRYISLQAITAPIPRARELVEALLSQDVLVAIATNPLFPEAATRERIAWAGLAEYTPAFSFITHSENMHFSKPSRAYYAEALARVGVEPDEALHIGDSARNDIDPASAIGIHTWRVNEADGLDGVYAHIRGREWRQRYPARQLEASMILPQYRGNIAALYGLLAEVKPHQWMQRPDPDEWSILNILCHLWQSEAPAHRARLETIVARDNPFIAAPPPPGPDIPPCHDNGWEILHCFQAEREATIRLLSALEPEQWQRTARHSIFGLTNLLEMAHFTAQHDRLHITQLCQTLGKCAE